MPTVAKADLNGVREARRMPRAKGTDAARASDRGSSEYDPAVRWVPCRARLVASSLTVRYATII